MGVYDILPGGAQIRCFWERRERHLKVGDEVGGLDRLPAYIVLLREGGYFRVSERKIAEIVEDGIPYSPDDFAFPVFDMWGDRVRSNEDLERSGLLGEHYYFTKRG